jgi:hypothetical protein
MTGPYRVVVRCDGEEYASPPMDENEAESAAMRFTTAVDRARCTGSSWVRFEAEGWGGLDLLAADVSVIGVRGVPNPRSGIPTYYTPEVVGAGMERR